MIAEMITTVCIAVGALAEQAATTRYAGGDPQPMISALQQNVTAQDDPVIVRRLIDVIKDPWLLPAVPSASAQIDAIIQYRDSTIRRCATERWG